MLCYLLGHSTGYWLAIILQIMLSHKLSKDLPFLPSLKLSIPFCSARPIYHPGSFLSHHLSLSLSSHLLWLSLNSSSKPSKSLLLNVSLHFYQLLQLLSKKASLHPALHRVDLHSGEESEILCCFYLLEYFEFKLWHFSESIYWDISLCGLVIKQLLCALLLWQQAPSPFHNAHFLTIKAILVQVLLELVWGETSVLVHPEVSQAICRDLCVCVLHPFWIDKGCPV